MDRLFFVALASLLISCAAIHIAPSTALPALIVVLASLVAMAVSILRSGE